MSKIPVIGSLVRPKNFPKELNKQIVVGDTAIDLATSYVGQVARIQYVKNRTLQVALRQEEIVGYSSIEEIGLQFFAGMQKLSDGSLKPINPHNHEIVWYPRYDLVPIDKIIEFEQIEVGDIWCLEKRHAIVFEISNRRIKKNEGWTSRKILCMRPDCQKETIWPNYNFKVFKTNKF